MLSGAILRKTREISQRETFRHFIVLISGRAGIYFISLVSQPILARLYTPSQFGEFAFLNSILAILLVGASGKYELGIVITKKQGKAIHLYSLAHLVLFGYTILLSLFLVFAPNVALLYLQKQGLSPSYFWIIPLIILFSGNWQILHNWLLRFKKFSQISFALIFQRALIFLTAVISFFFPIPINGLILSLAIGNIGLFAISFFFQKHSLELPSRLTLCYAHHFRDFPLFTIPTQFLHLLMTHFPVLWITFFFNKEDAGAFMLAHSMATIPLALLSSTFGQVFYQNLAQSEYSTHLQLTFKYCKLYSYFLIPIALFAFLFGEQLTQIFLGNSWNLAGKLISPISTLMLVHGIIHLFTYILLARRKLQLNLILQVIQFIACISAFSMGLYFREIYISIWFLVIFSSLHLAYTIFLVVKSEKPPVSENIKLHS